MHLMMSEPKDIFQSLSDPIRIRIVRLLSVTNEEVCLCEFVDSLLEPQYKLSRHVKILKHAGILSARRDGKWIYNRLVKRPDSLNHLYKFIRALNDDDQVFASDLDRFNRRLHLREDGRCQIGIQTVELAECVDCGSKQKKQ